MREKLYGMMNWPEIEGIEYSDQTNPADILGPHLTKDGLLIQAFIPDAKSVKINFTTTKKSCEMERMDEEGFFAALVDSKEVLKYKLFVEYESGDTYEYWDPYQFEPSAKLDDLRKFNAGIFYDSYKTLGAHAKKINNVQGVEFSVWAPYALRVSVVGDFNNWDGRKCQMSMIEDTGVFSIFVPGVNDGDSYKFEVKKKGDDTILKTDPYAFAYKADEDGTSVVTSIDSFNWGDSKWLDSRKKIVKNEQPMSVYELHLSSWKKNDDIKDTIKEIVNYVSSMKYTHVQLLPIMKKGNEDELGFATYGFYAVDENVATTDDIMMLVNELHKKNIGVIFEWCPNQFSSDEYGIKNYDGSCLYEHQDYQKGINPRLNTYLFNYARPEVTNYLISNAIYWTEVFHADGLLVNSVASMIYLDYDKNNGEWVPNIYGGNENLDAIEFLKHLNSIYKQQMNGAIIIAEDNSGYPELTGEVSENCIGFDMKYNEEWTKTVSDFMGVVPYLRNQSYNEISLTMLYQYCDSFIQGFPYSEVYMGKPSMIARMTGDSEEKKFANLRVNYGYMFMHPGRKLMFMGQDCAQYEAWDYQGELDWKLLDEDKHKKLNAYVKALNELYTSQPALFELDDDENGFEWINNISARESILVFARKAKKEDNLIVVVCNFDDVDREDYKIGVPMPGKYKEIFNSDKAEFGGNGFVNPRLKQSKEDECDGRVDSIRINVPALGMTVLSYSKVTVRQTKNSTAKASATKSAKSKSSVATKAIAEEKKATKAKTANEDTTQKATEVKVTEPKVADIKVDAKAEKSDDIKMATKTDEAKKSEEKKTAAKKTTAKKTVVKKATAKKTTSKAK